MESGIRRTFTRHWARRLRLPQRRRLADLRPQVPRLLRFHGTRGERRNSETYGAAPTWSGYQDSSTVDPVLGLRLAPWWKRLVAIIIDNIILGLGLFLLLLVLGIAANASHTHSSSTSSHGAVVLAGLLVLWLIASIPAGLYFAIMNGSRRGQTVGKLALSIAVRDARTGAPVGFWRALGRFLITLVFALLFYLPYLIDSLAPLWDKRRQAWHDKVAHSVVVDLKP